MPIARILMVDLLAIVWKVTLVMEQHVKVSKAKKIKTNDLWKTIEKIALTVVWFCAISIALSS